MKPNKLLVEKACELWAKMIQKPKFDALGKTGDRDDPNGSMLMASVMASMLADKHIPTQEQVEIFKSELKKWLMNKVDFDNEKKCFIIAEEGSWAFLYGLHVDYHPDSFLREAAKKAEIDNSVFPWKTSVCFHKDHLSLSYGYGAENVNYYPFDGQWLVTTLGGSEITKIFEYLRGEKPEFHIDK